MAATIIDGRAVAKAFKEEIAEKTVQMIAGSPPMQL